MAIDVDGLHWKRAGAGQLRRVPTATASTATARPQRRDRNGVDRNGADRNGATATARPQRRDRNGVDCNGCRPQPRGESLPGVVQMDQSEVPHERSAELCVVYWQWVCDTLGRSSAWLPADDSSRKRVDGEHEIETSVAGGMYTMSAIHALLGATVEGSRASRLGATRSPWREFVVRRIRRDTRSRRPCCRIHWDTLRLTQRPLAASSAPAWLS